MSELIWSREQWWIDHLVKERATYPYWDVKRSEDEPALLAYYRSASHAERGVWTKIKPGRYLTANCSGLLTAKQIKYWVEYHNRGTAPAEGDDLPEVHFATTPDDIEQVYLCGPPSCMSHEAGSYESSEHPVRVYGAGDLAIAYLRNQGRKDDRLEDAEHGDGLVVARAICWPEKKVFGRVYPSTDEEGWAEALSDAMLALGYTHIFNHDDSRSGFNGARMLRIEHDGKLIVPYLDTPCHNFTDDGDYLRMDHQGDMDGTSTDGVVNIEPEYEYRCEHCEEGFNGNPWSVYTRVSSRRNYYGTDEQTWCSCCGENNAFLCHGCDETFADWVDYDIWEGECYATHWLEDNTFTSDFSDTRYHNDDKVTMHNGEVWSKDEFHDNGQMIGDKNWPNDAAEAELERRAAAAEPTQASMELWS